MCYFLGLVCGSCHLQQFNAIKKELPVAKPGCQRRKYDAGNQIPDNLRNKSPPSAHQMPLTAVMFQSDEAIDLSLRLPPKKVRLEPRNEEVHDF